jgi:hypothetical protein
MGRLTTIASVLSLPPTLAHEATHWAVARCGTDDAAMAVEVRGGRAVTAWPPLESTALRVFAFLAPTVFGSVLAAVWLVSGFEPTPWRVLFAVGLAIYTVPSPADIRGACGLQEPQQETDN